MSDNDPHKEEILIDCCDLSNSTFLAHLLRLPDELIEKILLYLTPKDLMNYLNGFLQLNDWRDVEGSNGWVYPYSDNSLVKDVPWRFFYGLYRFSFTADHRRYLQTNSLRVWRKLEFEVTDIRGRIKIVLSALLNLLTTRVKENIRIKIDIVECPRYDQFTYSLREEVSNFFKQNTKEVTIYYEEDMYMLSIYVGQFSSLDALDLDDENETREKEGSDREDLDYVEWIPSLMSVTGLKKVTISSYTYCCLYDPITNPEWSNFANSLTYLDLVRVYICYNTIEEASVIEYICRSSPKLQVLYLPDIVLSHEISKSISNLKELSTLKISDDRPYKGFKLVKGCNYDNEEEIMHFIANFFDKTYKHMFKKFRLTLNRNSCQPSKEIEEMSFAFLLSDSFRISFV